VNYPLPGRSPLDNPPRPSPNDYRRPQTLIPEPVAAPPYPQSVNEKLAMINRQSWQLGQQLGSTKVGG
jgi:hypothetical protein